MTVEIPETAETAETPDAAATTKDAPATAVARQAEAGRRTWQHDVLAVLYREYCLLTRNRTNLLLAITPSAVYLLLFATSLSRLIGDVRYQGRPFGYAEFTVPALLLSSMLAAATTAGASLFQERMGNMDVELWSYPLRRGSYITAKLTAGAVLVLAQTLAALALAGVLFSFRWPADHWAALLLATVLASVAFNGLYLLLATAFKDFQRFTVTINVLAPVLLFAAPSFYPVEQMAPLLRWLSWADPVTYGIRCLRDAALFGFGTAWPWMLVLAGIALATGALITRSMVRQARRL
ncbi:ABC transporter permease [Streptomyces sp. 1331.2]|uniref:ABC transporter permease n=1 Tax=Streptomyces sp. 1331.2 TaxID=1938835 RepID=UPI000BCA2EE5|nr:ABC transporter permease [Streptomyces sp. 1331.2]SOB85361.1 ABC-2 type transport system permease protein [Streptomyces sp. 1331.2]